LAGLHTALVWAGRCGYDAVITTPVDTPMLPEDYVGRLRAKGLPSFAKNGTQVHALHGIWPVEDAVILETHILRGLRAARDWVELCDAKECVFSTAELKDPFVNINTPDDLSKLSWI